jgi:hypothetical protein
MNHIIYLLDVDVDVVGASVSSLSSSYLPNISTPPLPQQFSSLALDSKSNMRYSIENQSNIWKFDFEARKYLHILTPS